MFSIIAAIGKNNELGLKGKLIFSIKEDMQFFKDTTMGHPVFMGLNTFKSLPNILPGRKNYVLTHHPEDLPENVYPITDLNKFILAHKDSSEEIFIIGGGRVYSEMLPYCKNLYLTEINASSDADTFFPNFDKIDYDKIILKKGSSDDLNYTFAKYTKK